MTRFSPSVHTVCSIRNSVAVVELTRARLTGAVAWAGLSGAGSYLLHMALLHESDVARNDPDPAVGHRLIAYDAGLLKSLIRFST